MGQLNRRLFLGTAAVTAASYNRILGANERVRIGAIGTGSRCQYLLSVLNKVGRNDIVALCDVYEPHVFEAQSKYANNAKTCEQYQAVLDRKDIDAVVIGTPDHWHVPITIAAVQAGKDVYCEKPVTHTLDQGDVLIQAVHASGRVVQTGTQQRSWPHYFQAREVINSGQIGQVTFVRTYWYQNHLLHPSETSHIDTSKLNWKLFLGSAPDREFDSDQFSNWRWYWDFGGGAMTDLFIHWVDVVHWFTGENMPVRATGCGTKAILQHRQTPDTMSAALQYPSNIVEFDCALLGYIEGGGLMFRGTKGALRLHRRGFVVYDEIPSYSENYEPDKPRLEVRSQRDGAIDHMINFLDCLESRKLPNASVDIGVAAARAGHVANFALRGPGVWTASTPS